LKSAEKLKNIFGSGPHFAVIPSPNETPEFIKPIRYTTIPHKDHRSAIQVIEEVRIARSPQEDSILEEFHLSELTKLKSANLISDVIPPGTFSSSQTVTLSSGEAIIAGNGITTEELPLTRSTAMHDFIVGLLCFDTIYAPLPTLPIIHDLIGAKLVEELLKIDCLRFIYWEKLECLFFQNLNLLDYGNLVSSSIGNETLPERVDYEIRKRVMPNLG
jgi:hypothetical protein